MNEGINHRLFFGLEAQAPWPEDPPPARNLPVEERHLTLAFLGNVPLEPLMEMLDQLPLPSLTLTPVGMGEEILFLPEDKPRVVAHRIAFITQVDAVAGYQQQLYDWLENRGYRLDKRPFLSHVTLGRAPFDQKKWQSAFSPLPYYFPKLCLYESLGNLHYQVLWEHNFPNIFEEFAHTADIAYTIWGQTLEELLLHASLALSFRYPPFFTYLPKIPLSNPDHIVRVLNQMIAQCDLEIGCPFKAVSYHGKCIQSTLYEWEMIVDV